MPSQPMSKKRRKPMELNFVESDEMEVSMSQQTRDAQLEQRSLCVSPLQNVSIIKEEPETIDKQALLYERFAPKTHKELAVHSQKLKDLENALISIKSHRRCLIITGPSGSAKSTSVRLLCKKLNMAVQEYEEEESIIYTTNYGQEYIEESNSSSLSRESEEFLSFIRGYVAGFPTDCVVKLIRHLPSLAYIDPMLFRENLRYAVRQSRQPVIFCLCDVPSAYDVSPKKIFTPYFIEEEGYSTITFNPIAKLFLTKGLKRFRDLHMLSSKITDKTLSEIAELCNGDIRSAFNSIQFSMGVDESLKSVDSCLQTVLCDDKFHMIGRIMYSHRESLSMPCPQWLPEKLHRPSPEHDINKILTMSSMDPNELILYIHEYTTTFSPSVKSTWKILNSLSLADSMTDRWDVRQILRDKAKENSYKAEEYQSQIATRAVYFYNRPTLTATKLSFRKPRWKELDRELYNLKREFQQTVTSARTGANTAISQISMFLRMRIPVHSSQFDVISFLARPMNFSWINGRQQWRNLQRVREQTEIKPTGPIIFINNQKSVFPLIPAVNLDTEDRNDDNILIESSDDEVKSYDSFDEDPFN